MVRKGVGCVGCVDHHKKSISRIGLEITPVAWQVDTADRYHPLKGFCLKVGGGSCAITLFIMRSYD